MTNEVAARIQSDCVEENLPARAVVFAPGRTIVMTLTARVVVPTSSEWNVKSPTDTKQFNVSPG
jgi:hypothetical protein